MMTRRRREKAYAVLDRTSLGIGRAKIKPANSRKRHRGCAHGARLQRYIEIAVRQPFTAKRRCSSANSDEFCMRRRVSIGNRTIASPGNNCPVAHNGAADRHLAPCRGGACFVKRDFHK